MSIAVNDNVRPRISDDLYPERIPIEAVGYPLAAVMLLVALFVAAAVWWGLR